MRVRMSYSLEMDEIPAEVSDLIHKRIKDLHSALDLIEESCDRLREKDSDILVNVSAIDRVRQKLAAFDTVLLDAHAILTGFIEAARQEKNSQSPESVEETPSPWPPESLDV